MSSKKSEKLEQLGKRDSSKSETGKKTESDPKQEKTQSVIIHPVSQKPPEFSLPSSVRSHNESEEVTKSEVSTTRNMSPKKKADRSHEEKKQWLLSMQLLCVGNILE